MGTNELFSQTQFDTCNTCGNFECGRLALESEMVRNKSSIISKKIL